MPLQYPEGGLGDAVLASLAMVRNTVVKKLAVNNVPRSGEVGESLYHCTLPDPRQALPPSFSRCSESPPPLS